MPNYRRVWVPGGTYFFTVNLFKRGDNDLLVRHIDILRHAVDRVRQRYPFVIHAWVVLPDHLHCVIQLPEGDRDFAIRWRYIKGAFSRALVSEDPPTGSRRARRECSIWLGAPDP